MDAVPELPRPLRAHGVELFRAENWVFEAMADS